MEKLFLSQQNGVHLVDTAQYLPVSQEFQLHQEQKGKSFLFFGTKHGDDDDEKEE